MHRLNVAGPLTVVAQATRAPYRVGRRMEERRCHIWCDTTARSWWQKPLRLSEAIQAGEKAELEGRNAVRIITPSGQSFSVSEYKVIVAGVRVESE